MDISARLTSKGQVTIPKAVRDSLGLNEGDAILFRVQDSRAIISKTSDFLAMAGTVPVPPALRGVPWEEILRRSRKARAESRR